jgi:hypothetical protein
MSASVQRRSVFRWGWPISVCPSDEAEVLDHLRGFPAVVAVEVVTIARVAARIRLVHPRAFTRAVEAGAVAHYAVTAVGLGHAQPLAGPAERRRHVHEAEREKARAWIGVVAEGLPERAVLRVPARVLVLEPLEVLFVQRIEAPVRERPGGEGENRVAVVNAGGQTLTRALEDVGRDVEPELAELHYVGAVPVVTHPAIPLVEVGLGVGAAAAEVLHDHGGEDVDERVVDPERLLQVALDQRRVVIVLEDVSRVA